MQLGRICLNRIASLVCPIATCASTYSFSFILITEPRTSLANLGTVDKPTPVIALYKPGSNIVTKNNANSIVGKAINVSIIFIVTLSTAPPRYPLTAPINVPKTVPIPTTVTAINSEVFAPVTTLLNMSLPSSSVPHT